MKTVPENSDAGYYLTLVAVHGRCVCDPRNEMCFEAAGCALCSVLDIEMPCPVDPDADYPNPDRVTIEGSAEAERAAEVTP